MSLNASLLMCQNSEVISQVKLRQAGLLLTVYGLLLTVYGLRITAYCLPSQMGLYAPPPNWVKHWNEERCLKWQPRNVTKWSFQTSALLASEYVL